MRTVVGLLYPGLLRLTFDAPAVLQAGVELLPRASFRQRELSLVCTLFRYLQRQPPVPSLSEGCLPIRPLLLSQDPPRAQPLPTHLRPVRILLGHDL